MQPNAAVNTRLELLRGGRVKGAMMSAHIAWATKDRAPGDISRFWGALPQPLAEMLQGLILPVTWYEFSDLMAVDRAIVKVFGGGDSSVLRLVGAYSARLGLTGVYKAYRRESIHDFLTNGARLHPRFQDFGDALYLKTGLTRGEMAHSNYQSYSPLFCESALGYYQESLEIHGAHSVDVRETTCQCRAARSCTFVISWS